MKDEGFNDAFPMAPKKRTQMVMITPERLAALEASQAREAGLRDALNYAVSIIESYQLDIRDSQKIVGVDLAALGFCQGTIYRHAVSDIRKRVGVAAPPREGEGE